MANLDTLQRLAASRKTSLTRGTVFLPFGTTAYSVNVSGSVLPVSAAESVSVKSGDNVLVAIIEGTGQAEAVVLCRLSDTLHPSQGVVASVPPSSPTITVTGTDGASYTAYVLAGYSPTAGDNVEMFFLGGYPYVTKVGTTPAPAAPVVIAPPAAPSQSGTTPFTAADSATWWGSGGWGSWGNAAWVYQGDYGQGPLTGAFFYAGAPSQLQGRTITGGRVTLGPRVGAGNYNSPVTVNIYSHASSSRPGGNVAAVNGPVTVTAQPWQGLTTYELTAAQAADVVNGGGLFIQGGGYAAFQGIQSNAQSGTVYIDWSR